MMMDNQKVIRSGKLLENISYHNEGHSLTIESKSLSYDDLKRILESLWKGDGGRENGILNVLVLMGFLDVFPLLHCY